MFTKTRIDQLWSDKTVCLRLINYALINSRLRINDEENRFPFNQNSCWHGVPVVVPLSSFKTKKFQVQKEYSFCNDYFDIKLYFEKKYQQTSDGLNLDIYGENYKNHQYSKTVRNIGTEFISGRIIDWRFNSNYMNTFCNRNNELLLNTSIATRNLPHRGHMQMVKSLVDSGYFVNITITANPFYDNLGYIKEGWQKILKKYQLESITNVIEIYDQSYLAGPRDAYGQAALRKALGFNSFVVGRDHSGYGNLYDADESSNYLGKFNADFKIINYSGSYYCKKCEKVVAKDHSYTHKVENISMSMLRQYKKNEVSYSVVQHIIDQEIWEMDF